MTRLRGTYFARLSNGVATPPPYATVFAVVRDAPAWVEGIADRNLPHLAPPEELTETRNRVESAAEDDGVDDPELVAWNSVNFEAQYRDHLSRGGAREVLRTLVETVERRPVWLVSWRSRADLDHRSVLLEELRQRAELGPCEPGQHRWTRGVVPTTVVCGRCGYGSTSLTTGQLAQDIDIPARISGGVTQ
ncbi:hypothetical protein C440_12689 [Haloferax mucosum ATCC BAA-1512]|uniref:Uncharacterized protein n=1 Tax=Haloferax mucosum ATCC BAA-1512 TaxID=662479 RepID=M0IAC9_9EURY|nr:hypothetical protein [Haloferax mucosum]ELZ92977.1 hypothetical protein C440_12689 [Haloferax mucosum ATCC BAA-1512]